MKKFFNKVGLVIWLILKVIISVICMPTFIFFKLCFELCKMTYKEYFGNK